MPNFSELIKKGASSGSDTRYSLRDQDAIRRNFIVFLAITATVLLMYMSLFSLNGSLDQTTSLTYIIETAVWIVYGILHFPKG
ncbi:hypothetical protein [Paenibacillus hexagrammi]|uniref:Uncharacterized protein n=1 Tax=Paenibacillus hexagrammi TaxID=2908839 RepID=A0ABY3SFH7_9BACL|nr:hypothetical protein [Paenibacillus sp. YPD9-1]UJF32759.1 hypothetical protein L0M14_24730 [Paenibacillus sp. YPD9-1]